MKIIAIGGGEMGRPNKKGGFYSIETTSIDKEIITQTGKKNPKLLFVPTASFDSDNSERYFEVIEKHFSKLGCRVDVLYLIKDKLSKKEIEEKIMSADAIYVGGGNTLLMMKIWIKLGVDKILEKASQKGIVLSGLSAGMICWFKYGSSDSMRYYNSKADLIKVKGLNFVSALGCPHYNFEKDRKPDLKKLMKKTPGVAIALDNCCALEIIDKKYRIISSKKTANAYKVYWKDGKYFENVISKGKDLNPMSSLLNKD